MMFGLYNIDSEVINIISRGLDPETGEIMLDDAELDALTLQHEEKIENLALTVKQWRVDAANMRAEAARLTERARALERSSDRLESYLADELGGMKFETARVSVSFRTSKAVDIDEAVFLPWALEYGGGFLRQKAPEPDKAAIRAELTAGRSVPGAQLEVRQSITVK